MNDYTYITDFFVNGYFDYLLENNLTMVHFKIGKTVTFLVYKDELFIFDSVRSLNKAYKFYNVEKELCLEGIEYFKITKNYLSYMKKDDINIKKGVTFTVNKEKYLISYFSKGYQNNKKLSVAKVNKKMLYITEFCFNVVKNGLVVKNDIEKTAIVHVKNNSEYVIDLFNVEGIEPNNVSKKFPINKDLRELVNDKEAILSEARIGIFFVDGYKDCLTLEGNRSGGFIYYSLGNDNLMVYKFDTISLKELYVVLGELFMDFIPLNLTTDNEFLYDVLYKTFDGKIDFVLDKMNMYNRFVTELGVVLALNNYGDYKMDGFCLIIENNFNSLVNELEHISVYDYEAILEECVNSYRLSNLNDDFDDFDDFEEIEEIENEEEVDTTLLS
ncbi:MAG: hypothetical protein R3Y60_05510 [bacterium]